MPAATPPTTTFGYVAEGRLPHPGIGVPFDRTRPSESTEHPGQECKRRNDPSASSSRTATSIIAKAAMRCGPDRDDSELRDRPGTSLQRRARHSWLSVKAATRQSWPLCQGGAAAFDHRPAGRALPLSSRRHLGAYGLRLRNAREGTTRRGRFTSAIESQLSPLVSCPVRTTSTRLVVGRETAASPGPRESWSSSKSVSRCRSAAFRGRASAAAACSSACPSSRG